MPTSALRPRDNDTTPHTRHTMQHSAASATQTKTHSRHAEDASRTRAQSRLVPGRDCAGEGREARGEGREARSARAGQRRLQQGMARPGGPEFGALFGFDLLLFGVARRVCVRRVGDVHLRDTTLHYLITTCAHAWAAFLGACSGKPAAATTLRLGYWHPGFNPPASLCPYLFTSNPPAELLEPTLGAHSPCTLAAGARRHLPLRYDAKLRTGAYPASTHRDVEAEKLVAERVGEAAESELCRRIGRVADERYHRRCRCHNHDLPLQLQSAPHANQP